MASKLTDSVPCRHLLPRDDVERTKDLLRSLPEKAGDAVAAAGISAESWDMLLRAAVESLRGTNAATAADKRKFIAAVLEHARLGGYIGQWTFIGTEGRQDYMVTLPDGTLVAIEAKGGPDGNNMNIWDRPSWAQEFIVWSLSPESLAKQPGSAIWSGIATRLMPRMAHEGKLVDAFMFFDGRCGSALRPCPKVHGIRGNLRQEATTIPGACGGEDFLPAPCIYLFPRTYPQVPGTPKPPTRHVSECKMAHALLAAFGVEEAQMENSVHSVDVEAKGTAQGTEIKIEVVSRSWPDGESRQCSSRWKRLKRH